MMHPKPKWKKRIKRHPPSIIQGDKNTCLLCARSGEYSPKQTEEHHVFFGSGLRAVSEEHGFTCRLCVEHHRTGAAAVHNNQESREYLCRIFQEKYEATHTHEEFMDLVGKNYL